jgi:hypothetical protein
METITGTPCTEYVFASFCQLPELYVLRQVCRSCRKASLYQIPFTVLSILNGLDRSCTKRRKRDPCNTRLLIPKCQSTRFFNTFTKNKKLFDIDGEDLCDHNQHCYAKNYFFSRPVSCIDRMTNMNHALMSRSESWIIQCVVKNYSSFSKYKQKHSYDKAMQSFITMLGMLQCDGFIRLFPSSFISRKRKRVSMGEDHTTKKRRISKTHT